MFSHKSFKAIFIGFFIGFIRFDSKQRPSLDQIIKKQIKQYIS